MQHVTIPDRAVLAQRAENIETRWQLPARKWLRMMRSVSAATPSLPNAPAA